MTLTVPMEDLHPAHRSRAERLVTEARKLQRWAVFRREYAREADRTPHGDRLALRLEIGARHGMGERETEQALYGR